MCSGANAPVLQCRAGDWHFDRNRQEFSIARHHGADFDGAPLRRRAFCGLGERLVHVAGFDHVEATELLAGVGIGAVMDLKFTAFGDEDLCALGAVDHLAAGRGADGLGGNCVLSRADQTVVTHGVTLVGETNIPALVAADASALYARNVLDFLKLIVTKEATLKIDLEDDIVAACLMTQGGEVKRKS